MLSSMPGQAEPSCGASSAQRELTRVAHLHCVHDRDAHRDAGVNIIVANDFSASPRSNLCRRRVRHVPRAIWTFIAKSSARRTWSGCWDDASVPVAPLAGDDPGRSTTHRGAVANLPVNRPSSRVCAAARGHPTPASRQALPAAPADPDPRVVAAV